jgi:DNA-directed RNA polymerase specialized sigma24 family protein
MNSLQERQAELAKLARLGDREAANELTRSVWDWVYRKAHRYVHRTPLSVDDLASVMFSAMPQAIKSYQPGQGSFINYFAFAATRRVTRYMKDQAKEQRRLKLLKQVAGIEEAYEPSDPDAVDHVKYLLDQLKPLDRYIVEHMSGMHGKPVAACVLGKKVGIEWRRLRRRYLGLLESLREMSEVGA